MRFEELGKDEDIAWIDDGARRLFARCPRPHPRADSAVVRLISGVWEREPEQARRILRRRILTTAPALDEMDCGMVRVAAKRIDPGVALEAHPLAEGQRWVEVGEDLAGRGFELGDPRRGSRRGERADPEQAMRLALELTLGIETAEHRYLSHRRIAALLVSAEGQVLASALNSSGRNRTRHAEVNLVQGYCRATGQALPEGARVFTTLKSCKMCAGMIWEAASDPARLEVIYAEEDPGPNARLTVLTPESFERRRACAGRPGLCRTAIERQVRP